MLYREFKPSGAAAQFVKCFWTLEDAAPSSSVQRILPDGRCELILNCAESFEVFRSGQWERQPQAFMVGQITGPMMLRACGKANIVGIRFHPHGADLFGVPGEELTDRQISLDDLTKEARASVERLGDSPTDSLETLRSLMDHFAKDSEVDSQIAHAAAEFERTSGATPVGAMAQQLGLSSRQFERRFKAAVGVSPKFFCRVQRFQRVLSAMDRPGQSWVNVANDCGYYDQAHLIRDFQQLAGSAPTALLDQEIQLSRKFAR